MIYELPTLYSRRSDGKTQIVQLEVEDNKYRTKSGILDGKIVTSNWKVCCGKNIGRSNETTPNEQAMLEAKAKWDKKKSEKYSETQETMDEERIFQPMLAKTFEDYEKELFNNDGSLKENLYAQPKSDGLRATISKDGAFSRNGKPFVTIPHILEALAPLFEQYPDAILDGELYAHHLKEDFNKICSCVKRTKPKPEDFIEARQIQYHVYDLASSSNKFSTRQAELDVMWTTLNYSNNPVNTGLSDYIIQRVETVIISSRSDVDNQYERFIGDGYEGLMLRLDKPYENKRSKSLLKYKSFKDEEFTILDITEGVGNRSGLVGNMTFQRNGVQFKANVKGDREYLRDILENKEMYVGLSATVKYFNLTPPPQSVPRFPVVIKVGRESYE